MITITTYSQLQSYVEAAANGKIGLLLVEGGGGLSKTFTIKQTLKETKKPYLLLNGHATPAATYEQLFNHLDETVFINDIDGFFSNRTMLSLLKQLCDTSEVKTIQYNSKTPLMADLPREIFTSSNVIIDCNTLPHKNKDFYAFLTRGVHVLFAPTNEEIVAMLKTFFKDGEIIAYVEAIAALGAKLDLRKAIVAQQVKAAKLDWQQYLREELGVTDEEVFVGELMQRKLSYKQRSQLWVEKTGKCERTYDRLLKTLKKRGGKE